MDRFLYPVIVVFAWIWVNIHKALVFLGIPDGPGIGWVLSIVILTVLVRFAILPLYLKQIRSMRSMQVLQPELKKLQEKYKGRKDAASRQAQQEEMMALYKEAGSSPFASCLPMLVQLPVLFGLYRVIFAVERIKSGTYDYPNLGPLTKTVAADIDASKVFGVGLSQSLGTTPQMSLKAVFIVFIIVMVGFQFWTMRLSMSKNMPDQSDVDNPMVRSQKSMMYLMPLMFVFTGLVFKMGLLVYMVTTTLFGFFQQLWVIKTMPTPGSEAFKELMKKREKDYQKWAGPLYSDYEKQMQELGDDQVARDELVATTVSALRSKGAKQKVNSDFPEDWSDSEILEVYRPLALEPWKTVPDDMWMKQIVSQKKSEKAKREAVAERPRNLSRAQRKRAAERERLEAQAEEKRRKREQGKQKQARPGAELTPEELERRRQERKAQRRQQKKKGDR